MTLEMNTEEWVTVPVTFNFVCSRPFGELRIHRDYVAVLMEYPDAVLVPGWAKRADGEDYLREMSVAIRPAKES